MHLRVVAVTIALGGLLASGPALRAQDAGPAPRLFAAAGDVKALIAKAKAERKPDQPNFV